MWFFIGFRATRTTPVNSASSATRQQRGVKHIFKSLNILNVSHRRDTALIYLLYIDSSHDTLTLQHYSDTVTLQDGDTVTLQHCGLIPIVIRDAAAAGASVAAVSVRWRHQPTLLSGCVAILR